MKQKSTPTINPVKVITCGILFVAGINIAGADTGTNNVLQAVSAVVGMVMLVVAAVIANGLGKDHGR